jgi:hypothetical protein
MSLFNYKPTNFIKWNFVFKKTQNYSFINKLNNILNISKRVLGIMQLLHNNPLEKGPNKEGKRVVFVIMVQPVF